MAGDGTPVGYKLDGVPIEQHMRPGIRAIARTVNGEVASATINR